MSVSDDGFGEDFDFDESAIAHIDAVESQLASVRPVQSNSGQALPSNRRILVPDSPAPVKGRVSHAPSGSSASAASHATDLDLDDDFDWEDSSEKDGLQHAAEHLAPSFALVKTEGARNGAPENKRLLSSEQSASRGKRPAVRTSSSSNANGLTQRTLFGEAAADPAMLVISTQSRGSSGPRQTQSTKTWDRTAYAKSGANRLTAPLTPNVSQNLSFQAEDRIEECLSGTGRQIPLDGMKLQLDVEAARKFIYPINMAKRDYQYNIVQRALFDNVLVALPTGLGKTFIAAVVILNFFHWYPQGKIVFVAPTRPLVAQQQHACHGICGLPWDVACEMTGNTSKNRRGDEWEEKRIFYMTPQTLDNDLKTGDIDPKDIICLVVDEAHRATGNYAYCNIVAQIQAANPYFRVLALTATPGGNLERVQEVVDKLHISLIEIRSEDALDIRRYIHKKHEETITVEMPDDFKHIRELFLEVMRENCDSLFKHGLLHSPDPSNLNPFTIRRLYSERRDQLAGKPWLHSVISPTAQMAEARRYLDIFSIQMFQNRAKEVLNSMKKPDAKKMKLAQVLNLAASIPDQSHPKMTRSAEIILAHLAREQAAGNASSRVMIFCSLREAVHEIVELLNSYQPDIKATPFIGQAADKQGRGMTQKQQQEVIDKFKKGIVNVIVATSIGEEGLDIGEVDLIICYEAVKDSIRMLQRVGRTGRKREGRIVVLMAEGPESLIWQQSKDTYKGVQKTITAGSNLTVYEDVPRLVPPSIKPVPTFEELDQPEFRPELITNKKAAVKSAKTTERAKRRKERHSDAKRNVPEGALMGFLKASRLGGSMLEGDDEDEGTAESSASSLSLQQQSRGLSDDSDDEALERGLILDRSVSTSILRKRPRTSQNGQVASSSPVSTSPEASGFSRKGTRLGARRPTSNPRLAIETNGNGTDKGKKRLVEQLPSSFDDDEFDTSWGLDVDAMSRLSQQAREDVRAKRHSSVEGSPEAPQRRRAHPLIAQLVASAGLEEGETSETSQGDPDPPASSPVVHASPLKGRASKVGRIPSSSPPEDSQEVPVIARRGRRPVLAALSSSPAAQDGDEVMGPPALPVRKGKTRSNGTEAHLSKKGRSSQAKDAPTASSKKAKEPKRRRIGTSPTSKALFQWEAERDTDEERRGNRSDSDNEGLDTDEADSSDLDFAGDFAPTQAPKGYNQASIYQQSLLTQAAPTPFKRKVIGGFVGGRFGQPQTPSSGGRSGPSRVPGTDDDTYSLDSFCVDDDDVEVVEYDTDDSDL